MVGSEQSSVKNEWSDLNVRILFNSFISKGSPVVWITVEKIREC